jgi:hypothetical protein
MNLMIRNKPRVRAVGGAAAVATALAAGALVFGQAPDRPLPRQDGPLRGDDFPPSEGSPDFDGPRAFGPGGFGPRRLGFGGPGGPGGPGGKMPEIALVKQFDRNGDGWLNREERKAAREHLNQQPASGRRFGGPGGRRGGFGPPGVEEEPPQPGQRLAPAEVKSYPEAALYAANALRTLFLEFEESDWEKELAAFKQTDVQVPARLTVDGKVYPDVGVHFHGMSSFMMVGEGRKRSLVLTLDLAHKDQELGGYRKLNLLNSHEDPSFLHTVLALAIAREYLPAPQANLVRVVINGESWGIYVNQQHFNKGFAKEWFGTAKGARWKVPGSPNGRGGLDYLGDDVAAYKRIYDLKSKDEPKSWAALIGLCKALNETPADKAEEALAPLLDLDGVLKFLAWENVIASGDGFYARASDYDLYQDTRGRFHVIPYDANEAFRAGGGPGGPGGRGGPGGPGGFGPGMFLAAPMFEQADANKDRKLTLAELATLGDTWFDKLDPDKTGAVSADQFLARFGRLVPTMQAPDGFGPPGGGNQDGSRRGVGPAMFISRGLFTAADADRDDSLTRAELKATLARWFRDWDKAKAGALIEETLRAGLNETLRPDFAGRRDGPDGAGMMGGGGGRRGRGGRGEGGVNLDPLVAADDANKPLLSRLLAVPALRARYLGYVRDMAQKWLSWEKLGPMAQQYHDLIAADVKADTRKLYSYEAFATSLTAGTPATGGGEARGANLKSFVEQRRAFLLNHAQVKEAALY